MRYKFAREGIDTVLDTHLNKDSLHWDEKPIVVNYSNEWDLNNILGTAHDLRREDDGWITAEIEWNEKGELIAHQLGEDCYLTIYANQVSEQDQRRTGGQRVIRMAKLRAIYATMGSDPWAEKEKE